MKKLVLILSLATVFVACKTENKDGMATSDASTEMPKDDMSSEQQEAWKIAEAYGAEDWDKVKEIKFTFNVDRGENHMERSWTWNPQTKDITMKAGDDTVNYNRNDMDSLAVTSDKGFINDSYWLLAPLHLVWDDAKITVQDTATAPISKDMMHKITLTYGGDAGGYTPGDAYDMFYGDDYVVKEWIYRSGNSPQPSMMTTWEDYEDIDGIKVAKTHKGPDGDFKLYFTNVAVETE